MNLIAASKLPLSSITGSMLSGARSNNWVYFVARSGVMRALQPAYSVSPSSILNILKCLLQTRRNQMKSGHSLKHGPRTSQGPGHESRSCAWGNLSNLVPAKHRGCTAWDLYPHPRFWGWFTLTPRINPCSKIPIYHMRWLWSENFGRIFAQTCSPRTMFPWSVWNATNGIWKGVRNFLTHQRTEKITTTISIIMITATMIIITISTTAQTSRNNKDMKKW